MRKVTATFAAGLLAWAEGAFAHAGHDVHAAGWTAWTPDPWIVALLVIAGMLYLVGWLRLAWHGKATQALGIALPLSFAAGLLTLVIALISPLDALAAKRFSAHMVQHLLLMLIAPPLLVWSRPAYVWLWTLPLERRQRVGRFWTRSAALQGLYRFLMRPLVTWSLASVALWFWHIPGPYGLALGNEGVHALEHMSFFLTSLSFWTLVERPPGRNGAGRGAAMIMVATFALQNGMLGALLTFGTVPLYHAHAAADAQYLVEDQQLAGLIMWVPASVVHLAALVVLFVTWLNGARDASLSVRERRTA